MHAAHRTGAPRVRHYHWRDTGGAFPRATCSTTSCATGRTFPTSERFVLDRIFFLAGPVVWVVRLIYWIVSRTIKRGSWVSNLIAAFGESLNLFIFGIVFLGSYLVLIHVRIWSLCLSPWQAEVHQKHIPYALSIAFFYIWGFTGLPCLDNSNFFIL
jgi:hypothetical protein